MAAVAAGAAIVGAGIAIYGAISSADAQNQMDQERATVAQQQAAELQAREVQNEALVDQQAMRQKLQFGASYAASGKAGTGVGSQLQIQNQADLQNVVSNRETQFQEMMLNEQAGIDTTLGQQALTAGTVNAIGAGIKGVSGAAGIATAGGANPGYGGAQGLGSYPGLSTGTGPGYNLGGGATSGG